MNQEIKPIKVGERTYIQRQFIKWNNYWMACKDKEKREKIFDQAVKMGEFLEQELKNRQRE